jgi:hypothetical protein
MLVSTNQIKQRRQIPHRSRFSQQVSQGRIEFTAATDLPSQQRQPVEHSKTDGKTDMPAAWRLMTTPIVGIGIRAPDLEIPLDERHSRDFLFGSQTGALPGDMPNIFSRRMRSCSFCQLGLTPVSLTPEGSTARSATKPSPPRVIRGSSLTTLYEATQRDEPDR